MDPSQDRSRTSPAQSTVLRALEAEASPVTLSSLCAATSLHPNTVREHLEALEQTGLVRRSKAPTRGRGRPAWEYSLVAGGEDPVVAEYAGLAATLAAALSRLSRHPGRDAVDAGRTWGAQLAAGTTAPDGSGAVARRRAVVALLERLRFSPTTGPRATTVRLTSCPLLGVAEQYPDVVCGIHRGLVEGALDRWGDSTTDVALRPFAEPGACLLTMTPAGSADRP